MRTAVAISLSVLVVASAAFTFHDRGTEDGRPQRSNAGVIGVPGAEAALAPAAEPYLPVTWERPSGPMKVALQAGHWKAAEAPAEQARLRANGTRGGGKAEWEVNLEIARQTAKLLQEAGYEVDILPTTIPPRYWADLFVSIHADGNPSPSLSGYRAAAPRRDATGRAEEFVALLERSYGQATGLPRYPTVTRRMVNYYAFNWRRYQHALHPMTVAVILETGFLTSPRDRQVIVDSPARAARGIAEAVQVFLETPPPDRTPVPAMAVPYLEPAVTLRNPAAR